VFHVTSVGAARQARLPFVAIVHRAELSRRTARTRRAVERWDSSVAESRSSRTFGPVPSRRRRTRAVAVQAGVSLAGTPDRSVVERASINHRGRPLTRGRKNRVGIAREVKHKVGHHLTKVCGGAGASPSLARPSSPRESGASSGRSRSRARSRRPRGRCRRCPSPRTAPSDPGQGTRSPRSCRP
jgi:hypothetical protein